MQEIRSRIAFADEQFQKGVIQHIPTCLRIPIPTADAQQVMHNVFLSRQ